LYQHFADGLYQTRPFMPVPIPLGKIGICLARRRGVNEIERRDKIRIERKGVSLDEGQRIVRLGINVHAKDIKARSVVS
jgi:hypothetical protein